MNGQSFIFLFEKEVGCFACLVSLAFKLFPLNAMAVANIESPVPCKTYHFLHEMFIV